MRTICLILLIFFTNFGFCLSRRYDNFTLYSVTPTEQYHLSFFHNLMSQKYIDVTFWKKPSKLFNDVHFVVNPNHSEIFRERSQHYKLDPRILLANIQREFDAQSFKKYATPKIDTFTWDANHSLDDIYQWMLDLAVKYPNTVELLTIGKSFQGRDIRAMLIRKNKNKDCVIVDAGIHGNEWISITFVTFLMKKLIYANDEKDVLSDLARKYHWYLIPIVNPDGYVYSIKTDRLWRKNKRSFQTGEGVDLNRNFEHNFGKYETSGDVNDDNYGGPAPFSEPESKALANFITGNRINLKFYISFHAYGQKIILPYDDRVRHVDNFSEMDNYAKQAILKMYKVHGRKYGVGTTYDILGLRISGSSTSWVKKKFRTKYVIMFLLRDNGTYGYALPDDQILPTCEETLQGLIEIMTARRRRVRSDLFNASPKVKVVTSVALFAVICLLISLVFV